MLSTPGGTSSRLAIQRGVISAATLMFITAIWCSIASWDTMLRSAGSARRPVTNRVSANGAAVDVDRLAGDERRGRRGQPHRGGGDVGRTAPTAEWDTPRHLGAELRGGALG